MAFFRLFRVVAKHFSYQIGDLLERWLNMDFSRNFATICVRKYARDKVH